MPDLNIKLILMDMMYRRDCPLLLWAFRTPERRKIIDKAMKRGCGLIQPIQFLDLTEIRKANNVPDVVGRLF